MSKNNWEGRVMCKTWKYCWNEADDEIVSVIVQFLWTLKFIFSSSHRGL